MAHRHLGWRLVLKEERYTLHGPQGHLSERRECDSWQQQKKNMQESFVLTSRTRAIQHSWPFKLNQLSVPAVVGEWTMWEAAIYSNFIFSCHSREIQHFSVGVIAVVLFASPVSPYHLHCTVGVNSSCVLCLNPADSH